MPVQMGTNKYGNKPTTVAGYEFDSRLEANRYGELALMQKAGIITDLAVHPRWDLPVNGLVVARYEADFSYADVESGKLVVEDCKSTATKTPTYRLKAKLMLAIHGLRVVEIEA